MNVCVAEIYELKANGGSWREARDTPADIDYSARIIRWRQRYSRDNEAGNGDHKHLDEIEEPYVFSNLEALQADF
jgi:hypothetical protein